MTAKESVSLPFFPPPIVLLELTRAQEFKAWLVEERKCNPEHLSRDKTKKEFAVFVEDYNTATLPHEKVRRLCSRLG